MRGENNRGPTLAESLMSYPAKARHLRDTFARHDAIPWDALPRTAEGPTIAEQA
jgi:hypothetical protein